MECATFPVMVVFVCLSLNIYNTLVKVYVALSVFVLHLADVVHVGIFIFIGVNTL